MAHRQQPEYDHKRVHLEVYIRKAKAYFKATGSNDSGKERVLLTTSSTCTVKALSGQVAPTNPNSLTYEVPVPALDKYIDPKYHDVMESFWFFSGWQLQGEPIQQLIHQIRQSAGFYVAGVPDRMPLQANHLRSPIQVSAEAAVTETGYIKGPK